MTKNEVGASIKIATEPALISISPIYQQNHLEIRSSGIIVPYRIGNPKQLRYPTHID